MMMAKPDPWHNDPKLHDIEMRLWRIENALIFLLRSHIEPKFRQDGLPDDNADKMQIDTILHGER